MRDACAVKPDGGDAPDFKRIPSSAIAVFLLPLMAGIAGAFLAGRWAAVHALADPGTWQVAGMAAGLIAGVVLARGVVRLRRRDGSCPQGGEP